MRFTQTKVTPLRPEPVLAPDDEIKLTLTLDPVTNDQGKAIRVTAVEWRFQFEVVE